LKQYNRGKSQVMLNRTMFHLSFFFLYCYVYVFVLCIYDKIYTQGLGPDQSKSNYQCNLAEGIRALQQGLWRDHISSSFSLYFATSYHFGRKAKEKSILWRHFLPRRDATSNPFYGNSWLFSSQLKHRKGIP
jgi:hypothetical protein